MTPASSGAPATGTEPPDRCPAKKTTGEAVVQCTMTSGHGPLHTTGRYVIWNDDDEYAVAPGAPFVAPEDCECDRDLPLDRGGPHIPLCPAALRHQLGANILVSGVVVARNGLPRVETLPTDTEDCIPAGRIADLEAERGRAYEALDGVRALHKRRDTPAFNEVARDFFGGPPVRARHPAYSRCDHCQTEWPCATVSALSESEESNDV